MILETTQFSVQARMYTHGWGIPFGWQDRLSCPTVLDSSVSNKGSYFYMGGRTKSPDLVYGRRGTQIAGSYRAISVDSASSTHPGFEGHSRCLADNRGYVAKFNSGVVNSTKYFHGIDKKNTVVDVPTIKLSKCYDFCGSIA
jgi:ribosomal protein L31